MRMLERNISYRYYLLFYNGIFATQGGVKFAVVHNSTTGSGNFLEM